MSITMKVAMTNLPTANTSAREPIVEPASTGRGRTFRTSSLRTRMLFTAIVGAVTMILVTTSGLLALSFVKSQTEELERGVTVVIDSFEDLQSEIWEARLSVALAKSGASVGLVDRQLADVKSKFDSIDTLLAEYDTAFDIPQNDELASAIADYKSVVVDEFFPALKTGQGATSEAVRDTRVSPAADKMLVSVNQIRDAVNAEATSIAQRTSAGVRNSIFIMLALGVIGAGASLSLAQLTARRISRDVNSVNDSLKALALGDLTKVPSVQSRDETGQMAQSLIVAQDALRSTLRDVVGNSEQSVELTQTLSAASSQLAAASAETATQISVVASAADQVSGNVQTVAAGAEQMSASIREIAQNAQEATAVAQTAAATADATNVTISRLGDSSKEIGDVIKTITSIAEQTNLLALNATIEAARAGEAGKGFAVVASEVKDLAAESARAAEDVARRVEAIQNDTSSAVSAIVQISEIIGTINNYQLTIASAVEEQTATTNEMSRSATEAATGSIEIAANINAVASTVEETTSAVSEMDRNIEAVAEGARGIEKDVNVFVF